MFDRLVSKGMTVRRPHMSTGAWIFTGLVSAAVLAPASVYAVTASDVRLVGSPAANYASVTTQHQVLTAPISPQNVVTAVTVVQSGCQTVYTPPAGKAIMVTSVTYNYGSGTAGVENFGGLLDGACSKVYDQIDGVAAYDVIQHTFPTGIPMAGVAATSSGTGAITVFIQGYLIPSSAVPAHATTSHMTKSIKSWPSGR
jgi:hypothetical protein